jgi:hypothetical protein
MTVQTTGDVMKEKTGKGDPALYNARLQELQRIDLLATSGWPLTDLRDEEIIAFAIFRALDAGLKQRIRIGGKEEMVGGLPMTMAMIEFIRDMRPSRNRQGRRELIEAIGKGRPVMPWEMPMTYQADQAAESKPSLWERINPFRRR